MSIIQKAVIFAKKEYIKNDPRHRWGHIKDIRKRALEIANQLDDVDYEILELAVIFHDINYHTSSTFKENYDRHVEASAEMAEKFLTENNYDESKKILVVQAILDHSTPYRKKHGDSVILEGKILYDADKSFFMKNGENNEYYNLLYLKETKKLIE